MSYLRHTVYDGCRFNISIMLYDESLKIYQYTTNTIFEDVSKDVAEWFVDNEDTAHWFVDVEEPRAVVVENMFGHNRVLPRFRYRIESIT